MAKAYHILLIAACLLLGITLSPARGADQRLRRFSARSPEEATAWQEASRAQLFELMKLKDLLAAEQAGRIALTPELSRTEQRERFTWYELTIQSTPGRRINVVLTVPQGRGPFPAVVCIHGHGGTRLSVHEPGIYRAFASELARRGFVTISTDVGQHKVYEEGRTLMGERLWDAMRLVSYLTSREDVDTQRIGCAGLSLGGEMTMWLGAMDTRIQATVSSGYLTTIANMRVGHCPCWEFPGLAENYDWADIYSLIASRPLLCQIGRKEPRQGGFPVEVAQAAFAEIQPSYRLLARPQAATLALHDEGHVFDLESALRFLGENLARVPVERQTAD